ncbi:hypothetical protein I352_02938 [Cryptococcus deuterogattii MMRL2647]|nr:hypothetical protein I352_02938 [Cryptococcus deuterogattii MMRL2647]
MMDAMKAIQGNIIEGEDCWLDHYGLPIKVNDDVETIIEFANETLVWLENVKTNRERLDTMEVREAILYECGDRNEVVTMLGTLDGMADAPNMQQLKTWRALITKRLLCKMGFNYKYRLDS